MNFWHISDIHIRSGFYEDIQYAIDLLIKDIQNANLPNNLLVIAGDIFETKTKVSSSDLECFHQIIQKFNFMKILVIPGNHDSSGPDQTDLVTAALYNRYNHVYLYNKSGTYHLNDFNVDFHILLPNTEYPGFFQLTPGRINVALMHEPVRGCKLYGSVTIDTQARYTIKDLEVFDCVLLGDIHQPQFLGKTGRIAYAGSLVQKNKGEGLLHGYIHWSISKTPVAQFKHLPLLSAFLIIQAVDGQIKYPDENLFIKAKYVELRYQNCENIEEISKEIHKKYGRLDNIVNAINQQTVTRSSPEVNMQADTLYNLLAESLQNSDHAEKILGIHQQLYNSISDELGTIKQKWRLNFLSWSNIFCYGENNHIDFTQLKGVVSLIGKNKTGKSSILDILIYALYNELNRGDRKSMIRAGTHDYMVACGFSNADADYIIQRKGTNKTGGINMYKLSERKNGEWQDITGSDLLETYQKVKRLIGSHNDLTNINIALQENILIVNKKPDEQAAEFRKYFGLDKLEKIEEIVKEKIKELKQLKKSKKSDLEKSGLQDLVEDPNSSVKINTYMQELEKIQQEIKRLIEHKDKLNKKLFPMRFTMEEYEEQAKNMQVSDHTKDFLKTELEKMQMQMPDLVKMFDREINQWQEKKIAAARTTDPPQDERIDELVIQITSIGQKYEKQILEIQNKKGEFQKKIINQKPASAVNTQHTIKEYEKMISDINFQEEVLKKLEREVAILENHLATTSKKITELSEKIVKVEEIPDSLEDVRQKLAGLPKNIQQEPLPTLEKTIIQQRLARYEKQKQILHYLPMEEKIIPQMEEKFDKLEKDIQTLQKYSFAQGTVNAKLNLGIKNTLLEYQKLAEFKTILDKLSKGYDQEINNVLKYSESCECCKFNQKILQSDIDHMINVISDLYYYKTSEMANISFTLAKMYTIYLQRLDYEEYNHKYQILLNIERSKELTKMQTLEKQLAEQIKTRNNEKNVQTANQQKIQEYKQCISWLKHQKIQKHNDELNKLITEMEHDINILANEKENTLKLLQTELTEQQTARADYLAEQEQRINQQLQKIDQQLKVVMQKRDQTLKNYQTRVQNITQEIKSLEIWEELQEKKKKLEFNISVNKKLELVESELLKFNTAKDDLDGKIKDHQINIAKISFYKLLQDELIKLDDEKHAYDEYLKKINMKSGIPYQILSKSCAQLESDMNEMLNTITDFKISLQFDKKFGMFIQPNNIPAEQGSGFQKFVIDLALRICLCKNHPILPTFLIIDEGFGCMDKLHLENTKDFFHLLEMTKKFDYIIVISHLEELQTMTNKKLSIQQVDGVSRISAGVEITLPELTPNVQIVDSSVISIVDDKPFCLVCGKSLIRTTPEKHLETITHITKAKRSKK
jgi:exonuclease SbcC